MLYPLSQHDKREQQDIPKVERRQIHGVNAVMKIAQVYPHYYNTENWKSHGCHLDVSKVTRPAILDQRERDGIHVVKVHNESRIRNKTDHTAHRFAFQRKKDQWPEVSFFLAGQFVVH